MTVHELKTWPVYFDATWRGLKDFEVRVDDRDYTPGDYLVLREFEPGSLEYTGREMVALVKFCYQMDGVWDTFIAMTIEISDRVTI